MLKTSLVLSVLHFINMPKGMLVLSEDMLIVSHHGLAVDKLKGGKYCVVGIFTQKPAKGECENASQ